LILDVLHYSFRDGSIQNHLYSYLYPIQRQLRPSASGNIGDILETLKILPAPEKIFLKAARFPTPSVNSTQNIEHPPSSYIHNYIPR